MARVGGRSVRDWHDKFAALQRISGETEPTRIIKFFLSDNHKGQQNSIYTTLKSNLHVGKPYFGNTITFFINDAIENLPFNGSFDEFCDLGFEKWLLRLDEDCRAIATEGVTYHHFPHVRFYPRDIVGSPVDVWEQSGAVDQRFMYDTRHAAAAWERSRNHHVLTESHPYVYCRDTLPKVLETIQKDCSIVEEVILLGAGSPDKDWKILNEILAKKTDGTIRLLICDGSFYMLAETYAALNEHLDGVGAAQRVQIELYCFDFCNTSAWQICNLRKGANRLVFCMGGTIGNVREDQFIEAMRVVFDNNTILMIGSSFYDSLEELSTSGKSETESQYGSAARELVLSSVSKSLQENYKHMRVEDLIGQVDQEFLPAEASKKFPSIMASRVRGTHGALFSFAFKSNEQIHLSKRATHRRLYLAVSRRYLKKEFQEFIERALDANSSYVNNPEGKRFSYLIVRPREPHSRED